MLVDVSKLLKFNPDIGTEGTQHTITSIDSTGTYVTVNGTITADKSSVGGLRRVGFD